MSSSGTGPRPGAEPLARHEDCRVEDRGGADHVEAVTLASPWTPARGVRVTTDFGSDAIDRKPRLSKRGMTTE